MDEDFSRILYLVLGFLAGIGGSIIVDRNRRHLDRKEFREALINELRELRLRLALVAIHVHMRRGTLDHERLRWVASICKGHQGPSELDGFNDLIASLPGLSEEQLKQTVVAFNAIRPPDIRSSYKHYYAPVLGARLGQLGSLPSRVQAILLDINAQLMLFNEEVDRAMHFFDMTFQSVGEENYRIAVENYGRGEVNIATCAKLIVDRISQLPDFQIS